MFQQTLMNGYAPMVPPQMLPLHPHPSYMYRPAMSELGQMQVRDQGMYMQGPMSTPIQNSQKVSPAEAISQLASMKSDLKKSKGVSKLRIPRTKTKEDVKPALSKEDMIASLKGGLGQPKKLEGKSKLEDIFSYRQAIHKRKTDKKVDDFDLLLPVKQTRIETPIPELGVTHLSPDFKEDILNSQIQQFFPTKQEKTDELRILDGGESELLIDKIFFENSCSGASSKKSLSSSSSQASLDLNLESEVSSSFLQDSELQDFQKDSELN